MLVLGIETSCDETGVALVERDAAGRIRLLANALHSQVELLSRWRSSAPARA